MEHMISASDLRFRYASDAPWAVDGASVTVDKGEFVAVLGANGCGKSTLAKHFNAILLPEAGTVLVESMDTADEAHLYDIRQKVGMVFQNPDNQIVATVVEEDVAFALENLGVPPTRSAGASTTPWRWRASTNTGRKRPTSCPAARSSG